MNLELILWIVAGVVLSEVVYVIFLKADTLGEDWFIVKMFSFFSGAMIVGFEFFIVHRIEGETHYEYLLYELGFIGVIALFLYANKKLAEWVTK